MYILKISENFGLEYKFHAVSETIEQLRDEMIRLDKLRVRWFIEDHNGVQQFEYPCAVHRSIIRELPVNGVLLDIQKPPTKIIRFLGRK